MALSVKWISCPSHTLRTQTASGADLFKATKKSWGIGVDVGATQAKKSASVILSASCCGDDATIHVIAPTETSRRATLVLLTATAASVLSSPAKAEEDASQGELSSTGSSVITEEAENTLAAKDDAESVEIEEAATDIEAAESDTTTVTDVTVTSNGGDNPATEMEANSDVTVSAFADASFAVQEDELNACSYKYPVSLGPESPPLNWIETRKPERYSSAAPLSPDARLRIVSERLLISETIAVTVAISPPNESFLSLPPPPPPSGKGSSSSGWTARNVAYSLLADRISPRLSPEQRQQEATLVDAYAEVREGPSPLQYYVFEFLTQKSPTVSRLTGTGPVLRRSLAVAAEREGYLYMFTVSALEDKWGKYGPLFRELADSFRLDDTTPSFVPPWKDPWRFW